ncbi:hypothetical protein CLV24_12853 [Pontibacter ummariensis]|uniref:Uncharacterized protein n=1 Tax=Pontibacter ummariensis TaxID=1610492 RepID=A0A239KAU6_9BACT|nr:hypothetical protein [Pontibacter ummariensis]PRY06071.1 hypothetical protein CLV24_12853 [Pontibacter ummariensis]SNT14898.1 hypothetical protein SAMN06296052_12753 [Pontibacter ummariensis]
MKTSNKLLLGLLIVVLLGITTMMGIAKAYMVEEPVTEQEHVVVPSAPDAPEAPEVPSVPE